VVGDRKQGIWSGVCQALNELLRDPDVGFVTLIYMDHGNIPRGDGRCCDHARSFAFSDWATCCVEASKPLLILMDSSASWRLADDVFDRLRRGRSIDPFRFVAIVAAAESTAHQSLPMISREAELVHLMPEDELTIGRRGRAPPRGVVAGLLLNNSMFARRLIWLTAYNAAALNGVTVGESADVMNSGPAPMCYGFQAKVLCEDGRFGRLPVKEFFPWAVTSGKVAIPWLPGVTIDQFVPSEPVGDLVDDVFYWWGDREQDHAGGQVADYEDRAILISTDFRPQTLGPRWVVETDESAREAPIGTDVTGKIAFFAFPGLTAHLSLSHPVMAVVGGRARRQGWSALPDRSGLPICWVVGKLAIQAPRRGFVRSYDFRVKKCDEVCAGLQALGCPVLNSEFPCLERITGFCRGMEEVGLNYREQLEALVHSLPPRAFLSGRRHRKL
jgi:hypothetical protein